jgi:hypothetical protein
MSDGQESAPEAPVVERAELVDMPAAPEEVPMESVTQPARVMRIGSMIKQLLEEVRSAPLDERSRDRLAEIFDISVRDLADSLSPDLATELKKLAPNFSDGETPSDSELRIAQAQLVGWLEGLFHGIQATLMAQQVQARQQLEQMHRQLPPGAQAPVDPNALPDRPGVYL